MLVGDKVAIRARIEQDVATLHEELFNDVATRSGADSRAWRPTPTGASSPYCVMEPSSDFAAFSIVEVDSHELVGECVLWSIDLHNRSAHVGVAVRPGFRGRGYGTDTVRVLSKYGFDVLGLHRLQLETSENNGAMQSVASHCGFQVEGTTQDSSWQDGAFISELIYGLLAGQWRRTTDDQPTATPKS